MKNALLLVAAIVAVGVLDNVSAVVRHYYGRFRHGKVVTCPDTENLADVQLKAGWAAVTALFHKPVLRVKNCTLWPGKKGCAQGCVKDYWPSE